MSQDTAIGTGKRHMRHHKLVKRFRKHGKKRELRKMEKLGREMAKSGLSAVAVSQCHHQSQHVEDRKEMLPFLALLLGYGRQMRKRRTATAVQEEHGRPNRETNEEIRALLLGALSEEMRGPCIRMEHAVHDTVSAYIGDEFDERRLQTADYPEPFHDLVRAINREVKRLAEHGKRGQPAFQRDLAMISSNLEVISGELARCASTIHAQADDTNEKSTQSVARTAEVCRELREANEAMGRLEEAIKNITGHIKGVTDACDAAVSEAGGAQEHMTKLDHASQCAEKVVQTIYKIASQTRMLAINATIEAQRAGEAGQGFSVVAEEVKELAQASEKGTQQLRQAIDEIQAASTAVFASMGTISDRISVTNAQLQDVSQMAASVQQGSSTRVAEILANAIASADDTVRDFEQLDRGARAMRQEASGMDEAAKSLRGCIQELGGTVSTHTGLRPELAVERHVEVDLF